MSKLQNLKQSLNKSLNELSEDNLQLIDRFVQNLAEQETEEATKELLDIPDLLEEIELAKQTQSQTTNSNLDNSLCWWENVDGIFADDSIYDEAMSLGREYRNSQ